MIAENLQRHKLVTVILFGMIGMVTGILWIIWPSAHSWACYSALPSHMAKNGGEFTQRIANWGLGRNPHEPRADGIGIHSVGDFVFAVVFGVWSVDGCQQRPFPQLLANALAMHLS